MTKGDGGPIRILQVVGKGMGRAGLETWLMHVLRHIDRGRFHMDFVVETTEKLPYDDEIRALGSQVIPCLHHRRPLTYGRNFKRILRDQGPYDVVHSHFHHYSGYILRLARQAGVPTRVIHSHMDSSLDDKERGVPWHLYVNLMRRLTTENATAGLAVSRKAASAMFGPAWEADPRWRILYCGIDPKPFRASIDPVAVRAGLGIPADAFVIGHVGRFCEPKNHVFLVDVAAEVAKREPEMRLLLVGDGPLRPAIEQQVAQLGIADKVVFAGLRADVPRLLRAMDVFVFPSLYEGLGIAGVEAQAAGLPVVLSDVIPEEMDVVHPLMQRMFLTQPASAWAEAILAVRKTMPPITQQDSVSLIEKSHFNIAFGMRELEWIYAK